MFCFAFASWLRMRRSCKHASTRSRHEAVISAIAQVKLAAVAGNPEIGLSRHVLGGSETPHQPHGSGAENGSSRHFDAWAGAQAVEACV